MGDTITQEIIQVVELDPEIIQVVEIADRGLTGPAGLPVDILAAAPASPTEGYTYYNTTDHKLWFWNGTAWVDVTDAETFDGQDSPYYLSRDNHTGPSASKATPVDADNVVLLDSAASGVAKKLSWANIKATLKAYFDTIYAPIAGAGAVWGAITGTLSAQTDLQAALDAKVNDTGDTMTGDLSMVDSTPATSGSPFVESPKVYFKGQGWKTDTSVSEERVLRAGLFPETTSVGSKSPTFKLQAWANSVWSTIISIGASPSAYLNTRFNLRSPFYDQWGGMIEVDYIGGFSFRKVDGNLSALTIKQVGSSGFYDNFFCNPGNPYRPEIRCHFGSQIVLGAGVPTWVDPGQPGNAGGEHVLSEIPVRVPDVAYAAGWDGDTSVPTKNAIRDAVKGLDRSIQEALSTNGVAMISPGSSTAFNVVGMPAPTAVGTVSHPALAATNFRTQLRRGIVTSAATANSASELRSSVTQCWRGNEAGMGGFCKIDRFAVSSSTANQQVAVGLFATTSAISTTQVPSALTNCVFAGWDAADTNLQIMSNDASGTCTKVDLGSNFPANNTTAVYEVTFYAAPNDTQISYRVVRLDTGNVATGTITTDLPTNTTFLAWHAYANNGGTAAAVVLELIKMYLSTEV